LAIRPSGWRQTIPSWAKSSHISRRSDANLAGQHPLAARRDLRQDVAPVVGVAHEHGGDLAHAQLSHVLIVRRVAMTDIEACVAVLADLPDYFTPDTHDHVRHAPPDAASWLAEDDGDGVVGFVLTERRFPGAAEITFAAVRADRQGAGIGTRLVDAAVATLADDGVTLVEVKTLDESAGYEPYVATRAFWSARGFRQVDRIDPLPGWAPGSPAAIYVAALAPTRRRQV
jgi:ribosomal protein S18 acetylase RimI-like enzyme